METEEIPEFFVEGTEVPVSIAGAQQDERSSKHLSLLHFPRQYIKMLKTILKRVSYCEEMSHEYGERHRKEWIH